MSNSPKTTAALEAAIQAAMEADMPDIVSRLKAITKTLQQLNKNKVAGG